MEVLEAVAKKSLNGNGGRKTSQVIYEALRKYITDKPEVPKTLPSISKLTQTFNANYRTVRAALNKLKDEGLILYEQNVGVIVNNGHGNGIKPNIKNAIAYIRWEGDAFCSAICEGIRRFCNQEDIRQDLVILDAMKNHKRLLEGLQSISHAVDGVLLMPYEVSEYRKELQELVDHDTDLVSLDRIVPGVRNVSSVTCDDFGGAFQVVSHLLEVHKRPVYYLGQTDAPSSVRNRYLGWIEAMNQHGYMTTDPYCVQIESKEYELATSRALGWSKQIEFAGRIFDDHKEDVYPVFGMNEYTAISVYKAASQRGLEISKDVFVVGFGDMPLAFNSKPGLTTVKQDPEALGYEGAKVLYEKTMGNINRPINCVLPVNTIIRESSLPSTTMEKVI